MMRILLVIAIAAGYATYHFQNTNVDHKSINNSSSYQAQQNSNNGGEQAIRQAFESQSSNLQVEASGKVIKVLKDDTKPPRHQRFILALDNGISLLVAHNIDLASRVENLQAGDTVRFYGVYEWNKKGGVLHWTHHDPKGIHAAGWLQHNGQTYQ